MSYWVNLAKAAGHTKTVYGAAKELKRKHESLRQQWGDFAKQYPTVARYTESLAGIPRRYSATARAAGYKRRRSQQAPSYSTNRGALGGQGPSKRRRTTGPQGGPSSSSGGMLRAAYQRTQRKRFTRRQSVFRGRDAGKFRRPKKFKANKFVQSGAILKTDTGDIVSDAECVYVGHHTMPVVQLYRVIWFSIVRLFAKKAKLDFIQWDQDILPNMPVGAAPIRVEVEWKAQEGTANGVPIQLIMVGRSWRALADELKDIVAPIFDDGTDAMIESIRFGTDASGHTGDVVLRGTDISIQVVGNSVMTLQNRTNSGTAAGEDHSGILDVAHNPLRGKIYSGRGSTAAIKDGETTIASGLTSPVFDVTTGVMKFESDSASHNAGIINLLKKPPLPGIFRRVTKSAYVKLQPGEIKKSVCSSKYVFRLNTWFRNMKPQLRALAGGGFTNPTDFPYGKNTFFGLEKECDIGGASEPEITVGFEHTLTMSAVASHKVKHSCQPYNT